jgi:hypothetical protein
VKLRAQFSSFTRLTKREIIFLQLNKDKRGFFMKGKGKNERLTSKR